MVECSPATRAARVRFPADATGIIFFPIGQINFLPTLMRPSFQLWFVCLPCSLLSFKYAYYIAMLPLNDTFIDQLQPLHFNLLSICFDTHSLTPTSAPWAFHLPAHLQQTSYHLLYPAQSHHRRRASGNLSYQLLHLGHRNAFRRLDHDH